MGMQTTVGQVALMGGGQYEQSNGILVDERMSRFGGARHRGNLYVLVEVSGPAAGRDAAARLVTQAVRDTYFGQRGSVTAGLQQAVRQANGLLLEENRTSLPGERRTAGITCVVLRDEDLFFAQVGPAAAYLAHRGQVTRFPDVSPWLDDIPAEEMDAVPLGERREVNVSLFHAPVSEGDTLALVEENLARTVLPDDWPEILGQDSVEAVLEVLLSLGQGADLSAVVLQLGAGAAEPAAAAAAVTPAVAGPAVAGRSSAWSEIQDRAAEWFADGRHHLATAGKTTAAAASGFVGGLGAASVGLLKRLAPSGQSVERRQETTVTKSVKKARRQDKGQSDLVQKILMAVAIAIPIIVGAVVLITLLQRGQAHRAEIEGLWQQADGYWQQAQTTTDPPVVRASLTNAEQALDQLLALRPDYPGAADLQAKIQTRLDTINRVKRIAWIGELNAYPSDADLSRVVVQGAHIFVMDRRNGKVYHHQLDEALDKALNPDTLQDVLVSKGDQVGGVLVNDLVDMVWMPAGPNRQKASLVILESGGSLLDYDPATGELIPLRVANTDAWRFPELVGSHSGRFYVLDPSANKIWRYDPTADGYNNPPDEWLQGDVDLGGVVDMAIGDSIFLLYADGTIRKLTVGEPDAFDVTDWDTPPRSPTAIYTRPPDETQSLYIADRGNSRIVQCSKEGGFRQQFRVADTQAAKDGDPLATANNLFIDEFVGQAYVLSGNKLYLLVLPMGD